MNAPIFEKKHYNTPGHAHALTFSCYRRRHLFQDDKACEIFMAELARAKDKYDLRIWAYVLMPNHVHLLLWPTKPEYDISKPMRDMKSFTALRYIRHLRATKSASIDRLLVENSVDDELRFWQHGGGFDRNLWKGLAVHEMIEYIEGNPVRAGFVQHAADWKWSSAHARTNNAGLVPDRFQIPVLMR